MMVTLLPSLFLLMQALPSLLGAMKYHCLGLVSMRWSRIYTVSVIGVFQWSPPVVMLN